MPHLKNHPLDQALQTCRRAFFFTVFFGFVVSFLTLATSIYSLQVFDRVLLSGSYETLIGLTIIMVLFSGILNFVQAIRSQVTYKIGEYLDKKLSATTIEAAFTSLKKDGAKQTISQNIKDLHNIKSFIVSPNLIGAIDAPWSIIFMIVIFLIHPLLGVIVLVGALSLLLLAIVNNFLTKRLSLRANEISAAAYKELDVMVKNVEVIEAMRMKKNLIDNWQEIYDKNLAIAAQLHHKTNMISNFTKFVRSMIYVLTVAFGAVLVITNKMSSGGIIACSILSTKTLAPFDAAISLWNSVLTARRSYEKLKKLVDENYTESQKVSLPMPAGDLAIERVGFVSAQNQRPIIKGVNVAINAGEIVAIIGPTAAGKSTLAKLLIGINKPTTGTVRLDGADIMSWKDEELTNYLGYLPQDVELFNGSIKINIARMDKKGADEKIVNAAKMAHVHDMILKLPRGYETDIGVWGANISAGQRQRIALARAFYGDPKVVILDEPNSNLDQAGELALLNCLKMAKLKKTTVIIVSHRQQILAAVDKILVMVDGEAKFFGPRNEVLEQLQKS